MDFSTLRTKYKKFTYKQFLVDDTESCISLTFSYSIEGLDDFITTWFLPKINKISYDSEKVKSFAFALGLVEALSVWKLTCSSKFDIECGLLDDYQIKWFKKLLKNGMSEFFYKNNVFNVSDDIVSLTCTGEKYNTIDDCIITDKKVLVPIGGGKDSAVSLELLKDMDRYGFIVNERKATVDTFDASGLSKDKLIIAKRNFDQKIIKYNEEGFLNGHTPFSALISFASTFTAYINGISYVALSNESSANESTVKGLSVNHQYSKTYEYETDFIDYEKKYIKSGVSYFSFLRPLTEVGIAKIFSRLDKYHMVFRSCNVGSKKDIWCASCAKCLFVYIILSPFIEKDKMIKIFGKDLLDDIKLLEIFDKLIGKVAEKPFECVGSRDEVNAVMSYLTIDEKDNRALIKYYRTLNIKSEKVLDDLCLSFDDKNHLPEEFKGFIKGSLLYER